MRTTLGHESGDMTETEGSECGCDVWIIYEDLHVLGSATSLEEVGMELVFALSCGSLFYCCVCVLASIYSVGFSCMVFPMSLWFFWNFNIFLIGISHKLYKTIH